jgi:hypothetical protein
MNKKEMLIQAQQNENVSKIINDTSHFKDDTSKLQIFNPTAQMNKTLQGVITKYNTNIY